MQFINFRVQLVYVIARLAMLFGINSTSNARNRTRRTYKALNISAICGITSAINSK